MNKKGILVGEVLKIFLAVAGLLILALLAYNLISILTQRGKIQQAEAEMENIMKIIEEMEEGETKIYDLKTPADWALIGWPVEDLNPEICKINGWENCLCLCEYSFSKYWERIQGYGISIGTLAFVSFIPPLWSSDRVKEFALENLPHSKKKVLGDCNKFSVCREIEEEILLVNPVGFFAIFGKKSPILINGLVEDGLSLFIQKDKSKLRIEFGNKFNS